MGDWIVAFAAVIGALLYLYADMSAPDLSFADAVGPKAFPALIGIGLLLSGALLVLEMRRKRRAAAPAGPAAAGETAPAQSRHRLVLLAMLAWTAAYYFAFDRAGYLVSTVVYLFPMLVYFNRGKWITNVLVTLGFTLVAYLLFAKVLLVAIPAGLIGF